jgi:hypothetical protein
MSVSSRSYASIFPLPPDLIDIEWPEPRVLIQLYDSIRIENVSTLFEHTPSEFWTEWSCDFGQNESRRIRNTKYAIVRRFECADSDLAAELENSKHLLYRLYLSLKVVRATEDRFLVLHCTMEQGRVTTRDRWRNEFESKLLDHESGFPKRPEDLDEVARIAQNSLAILGDRTLPVTEAVYSLEIGYRAEFFNVQHLVWVVGLDALFSTDKNTTSAVVRTRIGEFLGEDFVIYPQNRDTDFPRLVGMSVRDSLKEIYDLRNYFAHGTWPNRDWAGKVCRTRVFGTAEVLYSGMLLETAVAVLRACLRKILTNTDLIAVFNDKAKVEAFFAARR